jgi:flagellar hook assembly protein FlgD
VAEPVRGLPIAGTVVTHWDGLDLRGSKAPTGIYYYQAIGGSNVARGRIVLVR